MQIYNIFFNPNASDLFLFPNKKFLRNILEHKDTKPQSVFRTINFASSRLCA